MGTTFYVIYCNFLDRITDDMYMELTMEETFEMMESLLMASIPKFKFPRFPLYHFDKTYEALKDESGNVISRGAFEKELTLEEINILAELMVIEWFERQLTSTRIVKQRYSGPDFKLTSQAAHMQRLQAIIESKIKQMDKQQFMYGRRKMTDEGMMVPNYDGLYTASGKTFLRYREASMLTSLERESGLW